MRCSPTTPARPPRRATGAGLTCDLILTRAVDRSDEHYLTSGNLLLDHLLGATVHVVDDPDAAFVRFAELLESASEHGRQLYGIGPGGSDAIGSLGYVAAGLELSAQLRDGRSTRRRSSWPPAPPARPPVWRSAPTSPGVELTLDVACVYHDAPATAAELDRADRRHCRTHSAHRPPPTRWTVDDAALGDGYGIPTADGQDAI